MPSRALRVLAVVDKVARVDVPEIIFAGENPRAFKRTLGTNELAGEVCVKEAPDRNSAQ